jgi:hypothetical protein
MAEERVVREVVEEVPSNEAVDGHIAAARDSVTLINDIIAKANGEPLSESKKDDIARNVAHLEHMLGMSWIRNTNADLSDLEKAVVDGKAVL